MVIIGIVLNDLFFNRIRSFHDILADFSVWSLIVTFIVLISISFFDNKTCRFLQAALFIAISGPMMTVARFTSFATWPFVIGVALLDRYGYLKKHLVPKIFLLVFWNLGWMVFFFINVGDGSIFLAFNHTCFIGAVLFLLYILFEDDVKKLILLNKKKDIELANKDKRIMELEPLSALGGRVSHVVHSFKNNMAQVSGVLYYIEQKKDFEKAAESLRTFSELIIDRIDNILMVARAGARQENELIDLRGLVEAIQYMYMEDKLFHQHVKTVIDIQDDFQIKAIRWDLIMLFENILKNALEAITEKNNYGQLNIVLTRGTLAISNNGGIMAVCENCSKDCMKCQLFIRPGYTTKPNGTGFGLEQVFSTVKKYGWSINIQTWDDITQFTISFPQIIEEKT